MDKYNFLIHMANKILAIWKLYTFSNKCRFEYLILGQQQQWTCTDSSSPETVWIWTFFQPFWTKLLAKLSLELLAQYRNYNISTESNRKIVISSEYNDIYECKRAPCCLVILTQTNELFAMISIEFICYHFHKWKLMEKSSISLWYNWTSNSSQPWSFS